MVTVQPTQPGIVSALVVMMSSWLQVQPTGLLIVHGRELLGRQDIEVDVQPPVSRASSYQLNLSCGESRQVAAGQLAVELRWADHRNRATQRRHSRGLDLVGVTRAEGHHRLRAHQWQHLAQFAGQAVDVATESQAQFTVGGLTGRGRQRRPGILVAINKEEPDFAVPIATGGERSEQDRAVAPDDKGHPGRG